MSPPGAEAASPSGVDFEVAFELFAAPNRASEELLGAQADVPTIEAEEKSDPWFSASKLDGRGQGGVETAAEEGAEAAGRICCEEVV